MELDDEHFAHTEDITRDGLIGNYVHGNEPGHHIPYLYNWAGAPKKTQERVRIDPGNHVRDAPDGLCGNDDAGQMSAWYISARWDSTPSLLVLTSMPWVVHWLNLLWYNWKMGKSWRSRRQSITKNVYVKKVLVNGQDIKRLYITHNELMNGENHLPDEQSVRYRLLFLGLKRLLKSSRLSELIS
jgi:putative alpha-1,2-mannosidase